MTTERKYALAFACFVILVNAWQMPELSTFWLIVSGLIAYYAFLFSGRLMDWISRR